MGVFLYVKFHQTFHTCWKLSTAGKSDAISNASKNFTDQVSSVIYDTLEITCTKLSPEGALYIIDQIDTSDKDCTLRYLFSNLENNNIGKYAEFSGLTNQYGACVYAITKNQFKKSYNIIDATLRETIQYKSGIIDSLKERWSISRSNDI